MTRTLGCDTPRNKFVITMGLFTFRSRKNGGKLTSPALAILHRETFEGVDKKIGYVCQLLEASFWSRKLDTAILLTEILERILPLCASNHFFFLFESFILAL